MTDRDLTPETTNRQPTDDTQPKNPGVEGAPFEWCDTTKVEAVVTLGRFTPDGSSYARSWPKHTAEGGCHPEREYGPCRALPKLIRHNLKKLLDQRYHHPAYLLSYMPPEVPHRLSQEVLTEPGRLAEVGGSIDLHLALFDVDKHGVEAEDVDVWFEGQRPRIEALQKRHGCLVYRSKSGYRILGVRKTPLSIKGTGNVLEWKRLYLAEINYLARAFGIGFDASDGTKLDQLIDWQRLQRVPHDLRSEDGTPEERDILGDIGQIGYWAPPLEERDHAWARDQVKSRGIKSKPRKAKASHQSEPTTHDKPTVLRLLLNARGLLGGEIEPGKWSVTCPAANQHSSSSNGTDTVLWENGGKLGHIHCSHAGCGHSAWKLEDWYGQFDVADIEKAKATVGLGARAGGQEFNADPEFRIGAKDDWRTIARVARKHLKPFVLWQGSLYAFDGARYERREAADFKREIRKVCDRMWRMARPSKDAPPIPTRFIASTLTDHEVMAALQTEPDVMQAAKEQPFLVDCEANKKLKKISFDSLVFFENNVLDITSGKARRPSPRVFVSRTLGCKYYSPADIEVLREQQKSEPSVIVPSLECAAWLEFVAKQWGPNSKGGLDEESTMLLQEWMGYCLTRTCEHRKMLFFKGPKGSGKGTIAKVIEAMVGDGFGSFQVASLSSSFGLASWRNKDVMCDADARWGKSDANAQAMATSRLLKLPANDKTQVEIKNKEDVEIGGRKIILLSNVSFKFIDTSDALVGRLLILLHQESFEGREDRQLLGRLLGELPGIVVWAFEGLARLRRNNQFTVPRYHETIKNEIADLGNPTRVFVREECDVESHLRVRVDEIYAAYAANTKRLGLGIMSQPNFEAALSGCMEERGNTLERKRMMVNGTRDWWYVGLNLSRASSSVALTDRQNVRAWFASPTYRDWSERGVETVWPGQYALLRDVMEHALGIPRERQPHQEQRVLGALTAEGYEPDAKGRYVIPHRDVAGGAVRHLHSVPRLSPPVEALGVESATSEASLTAEASGVAFTDAEIEAIVRPVPADYDFAELIRRQNAAGDNVDGLFDARGTAALRRARLDRAVERAHETMCSGPDESALAVG